MLPNRSVLDRLRLHILNILKEKNRLPAGIRKYGAARGALFCVSMKINALKSIKYLRGILPGTDPLDQEPR